MPNLEFSPSFWPSAENYQGDKIRLRDRITEFMQWKTIGTVPYVPFDKDKSSARDDQGRVFRPYARNQVRHCHCGFFPNGDPLIAYRVLPGGGLKLLSITHHDEMFNKAKRDDFVRKHKDDLPENEHPMRRLMNIVEYEDMTDAQKRIVDAAEAPSAGTIPAELSPEERLAWIRKMAGITE